MTSNFLECSTSGSSNSIRLPWRRGRRLKKNGKARVGGEVGVGMQQAGVKGAARLTGQAPHAAKLSVSCIRELLSSRFREHNSGTLHHRYIMRQAGLCSCLLHSVSVKLQSGCLSCCNSFALVMAKKQCVANSSCELTMSPLITLGKAPLDSF